MLQSPNFVYCQSSVTLGSEGKHSPTSFTIDPASGSLVSCRVTKPERHFGSESYAKKSISQQRDCHTGNESGIVAKGLDVGTTCCSRRESELPNSGEALMSVAGRPSGKLPNGLGCRPYPKLVTSSRWRTVGIGDWYATRWRER